LVSSNFSYKPSYTRDIKHYTKLQWFLTALKDKNGEAKLVSNEKQDER
jgi:hypothetical protein